MYLGFDLLGTELRFCEAAGAALLAGKPGAVQQIELGALAPLLVEAEQSLRITGSPGESAALRDAEAQHAGGQRAWVRRYAEAFAPFRALAAEVRGIGLATAYATPPIVCQGLGSLFAQRERAGVPAARQRRVFACEAPIALALELLATKQVAVPAELVLLTPGIEAVELTALKLTAEGGDLRVEVRGFVEIPFEGEVGAAFAGRIGAVCQGVARDVAWFATEEATAALPAAIVSALGMVPNERRSVPLESLAWGAARYAAIHDKVASGTGFRGLSIERIAARPVGVVGSNRAGEGAWRRLMPAGQPYDESIAPLIAAATAGGVLVLGELARVVDPPPLWLSQADWDARRLVVHATCRVSRPAGAGQSLQIKRSRPGGLCIWSGNEFSAQWVA